MRIFSISLLLPFMLIMLACSEKQQQLISTDAALEKFGPTLEGHAFYVYPEGRDNPIHWFDSIPEGKIRNPEQAKSFKMEAQPDEFYVYQLGVWAITGDISDIQLDFSALTGKNEQKIPVEKMTCFNKGGINFRGEPFTKEVPVQQGRVQALWIGIDLKDMETGKYSGSVTVAANGKTQEIPLELEISGEPLPNKGYNQGERLSRLDWLNTTAGFNEEVTKGFLPVDVSGNQINILGRSLKISENGLPGKIMSSFGPSNQNLKEEASPVVDNPFRFIVEKTNGEIIRLTPQELSIVDQTPSQTIWTVLNTSDACDLEVTGQMEFDGFVNYQLTLKAKQPLDIKDIRLEIPVVKEKARYMMGLGHEGGYLTPDWKWKWDVSKNQDMLWVGAVNGGLRIKWKAENYARPLVNIYYKFGPLNLPPSWGNNGKGGVNVAPVKGDMMINAYSGARKMEPGEALHYDFELLITPFKLINKDIKYNDRYFHGGGTNAAAKVEKAKEAGANIINIHHAEDIYPFINYPYLDDHVEELTQLVERAHENDLRMKFYYTTRELTKNLPEFWAFYSLDGEVIYPGPGNESRTEALHPDGPHEWLIKNVRENYIPAWSSLIKEGKFEGETDLSVITTPDSRLNNFYIGGLDWMVENMKIDGVYIDDSALDRVTLRRARKIIDDSRPEGRMDLHSWNHFNDWAGYTNCLNLYMDLLPYFDLVWIGEGRDYDRLPDHWLIEVSGVPFGLPGQMLQGGGNPWRGMVYGITNRAGWTKWPPKYLWNFFDEYAFDQREMIGYWDERCPVKTSNENLVASVFDGAEDIIIAIGNWSAEEQTGTLQIDWSKVGADASNAKLQAPAITDFQEALTLNPKEAVTVEGGKGLMFVLKKQ